MERESQSLILASTTLPLEAASDVEKRMTRIARLAGLLLLGASLCVSARNMPNDSANSTTVTRTATDHALQQEIQQRLRQDSRLNLVTVTVKNRNVTLQGGVPSNTDRNMAFTIANAVPGTGKVNNNTVTLVDSIHPDLAPGATAEAGQHPKIEKK